MIGFYLAMFFGGAFLTNSVPHLVSGMLGGKFPTPFASPPGRGESSPLVNVLWGFFNLGVAYALLGYFFTLNLHLLPEVAAAALGSLLMAMHHAIHFGKIYR